MPKKIAPFRVFAFELKRKYERKGIPIYNDRHLNEMAGAEWNRLSDADKEVYKTKAKTMDKVPTSSKKTYNSLGEDIQEVEAKKQKLVEAKESIQSELMLMLENASEIGELDEMVFYFISTSSFYFGDDVYPAELAMAKFSLKRGIFDDIQIRINPGELPKGSRCEAEERAKSTHKYPLPPNCDGETDYMNILETMMTFLHPLEKLPIFFTEGYDTNMVPLMETTKVIRKIFYESQEDDMISELKIIPIAELFHKLQCMTVDAKNRSNGTNESKFSSVAYAYEQLKKDSFAYHTKACDYHNDYEDGGAVINCCLSKVCRFGYTISYWCSNKSRYEIVEGKHYPQGYKISS